MSKVILVESLILRWAPNFRGLTPTWGWKRLTSRSLCKFVIIFRFHLFVRLIFIRRNNAATHKKGSCQSAQEALDEMGKLHIENRIDYSISSSALFYFSSSSCYRYRRWINQWISFLSYFRNLRYNLHLHHWPFVFYVYCSANFWDKGNGLEISNLNLRKG